LERGDGVAQPNPLQPLEDDGAIPRRGHCCALLVGATWGRQPHTNNRQCSLMCKGVDASSRGWLQPRVNTGRLLLGVRDGPANDSQIKKQNCNVWRQWAPSVARAAPGQ
jgi:hypothetical protein